MIGPCPREMPVSVSETDARHERSPRPARTHHRMDQRLICLNCAYDLTGVPEGVCPECGREWSHEYFRRAALKDQFGRPVADAIAFACGGLILAVLAYGAIAVGARYGASAFLILGGVLGVGALFVGWGFVRAVLRAIARRREESGYPRGP